MCGSGAVLRVGHIGINKDVCSVPHTRGLKEMGEAAGMTKHR